jgi:hypothetical protein
MARARCASLARKVRDGLIKNRFEWLFNWFLNLPIFGVGHRVALVCKSNSKERLTIACHNRATTGENPGMNVFTRSLRVVGIAVGLIALVGGSAQDAQARKRPGRHYTKGHMRNGKWVSGYYSGSGRTLSRSSGSRSASDGGQARLQRLLKFTRTGDNRDLQPSQGLDASGENAPQSPSLAAATEYFQANPVTDITREETSFARQQRLERQMGLR